MIVGSHRKPSVYRVKTPYKKIVKCIRYRDPMMLARSVLRAPTIGDATKKEVVKVVHQESAVLCFKGSPLRATSMDSLSTFEWRLLAKEAEKRAPTLTAIVAAVVNPLRKFRRKRPGRLSAVGTSLSILLREKCRSLCLPQTLNSVAMYVCRTCS